MAETKLFEAALGIEAPWFMRDVAFDAKTRTLTIAMVYERQPLQGPAHEGRGPPRAIPLRRHLGVGPNPRHQWLLGGPEWSLPGRQAQGPRLWSILQDPHRDLPDRGQARLLKDQPAYGGSTHMNSTEPFCLRV